MSVTLDVLKVSGWLNSLASCRAERRAHGAGRGAGQETRGRNTRQTAGRQAMAAHAKGVQGTVRLQIGDRPRAERTENMWLMSLTLDVSKVSGWLNSLASCRAERRAHGAGRGAGQETRGRRCKQERAGKDPTT